MNRFAEIIYGRVNYVFETTLKQEELSTIFSPKTFWVDVTGVEIDVGWWYNGRSFEAPQTTEPTTQESAWVNPDTLALAEAVLELSDRIEKLEGGATNDNL